MSRSSRRGVVRGERDESPTQALPPSPLFPPPPETYPDAGAERTRKRTAVVVLLAVVLSLVLAAVAFGAFVVYDGQADRITDLRSERNQLRSQNTNLAAQLARSRTAAKTSSAKLAVASKNLRKARADVAAARKAATDKYGAGFSAGTQTGYSAGSSDSYNSGWSDGWDVGNDVGYDAAYRYCASVLVC